MPKFSDNPPAQHEIVEKNDLLLANTSTAAAPNSSSGCSGSLGKKVTEKDTCDTISSADASSAPSKSNGHASGALEEEKVSPSERAHVVVFLSIVVDGD